MTAPAGTTADRLGASATLLMMGWLSAVLWLDRADGGGSIWLQRGLGLLTWCVLIAAARRVSPTVRAQAAVVVVGGVWAAYGLFAAERPDALGAFWFVCLLGFLAWGPSKQVYVGAFVVVSWLELLGTGLGTWVWGSRDFTGWVTIGNPPSGAAGGYGWFDLAGLLLAPYLVRWFTRSAREPAAEPSE